MSSVDTSQFKAGLKLDIEDNPYVIVTNEFVKPGKGQAFNRVRLKHLISGKVLDRTFKSGEKATVADVDETNMRMLYRQGDIVVFMSDETFEQVEVPLSVIGENERWLLDETLYEVIFYKGQPVALAPPNFMELLIVDTQPGARGDTVSGRVMKPAKLASGATINVPIFIENGEKIKVDTRDGSYVARVQK